MPRPPTWKSGSTQRNRERPSTSRTSFAARAFASRLSRARRAAFGVPVVPEVNSTAAGSPAGGMAAIGLRCTALPPGVRPVFSSTSSPPCSIAPRTRPAVFVVLCPSANLPGARIGAGAATPAGSERALLAGGGRHGRPFRAGQTGSGLFARPAPGGRQPRHPARAPRRAPAPVGAERRLVLGARRVSDHRRTRVVAIETDLELQ